MPLMCHIYRLLGQGSEPWGIPAGRCSAGRQDFMVACTLTRSWYLQLPNGWQVSSLKLPLKRKGITLQAQGQQDVVMRTRCASPALKLLWSPELGVPRAWPGKPQLTKGTQGLAHGNSIAMESLCLSLLIYPLSLPAQCRHTFLCGCVRLWHSLLTPASNNLLLYGAHLDLLELISRQDTGVRDAISHSPIFWPLCSCT